MDNIWTRWFFSIIECSLFVFLLVMVMNITGKNEIFCYKMNEKALFRGSIVTTKQSADVDESCTYLSGTQVYSDAMDSLDDYNIYINRNQISGTEDLRENLVYTAQYEKRCTNTTIYFEKK